MSGICWFITTVPKLSGLKFVISQLGSSLFSLVFQCRHFHVMVVSKQCSKKVEGKSCKVFWCRLTWYKMNIPKNQLYFYILVTNIFQTKYISTKHWNYKMNKLYHLSSIKKYELLRVKSHKTWKYKTLLSDIEDLSKWNKWCTIMGLRARYC